MDFDEYKIKLGEKAALVSLVCDGLEGHTSIEQTQHSLNELHELLRTLGVEPGGQYVQNRKSLEAGTMLGKGKIQEIAKAAKEEGCTILVFDFELTASQMRNIKKLSDMDVIDRCMVILEIFAHHARTNEAKIQIEISRLKYMLPRLQSLWTHFSKQKGGIGMKGEGEQQLEMDKRIIRQRIEFYKKQLVQIETSREQQRKRRHKKAVTAALVGYTNAGKSSLMNKLCRVNVLSEDKLFATLDSTYRMLNPDTKPAMILIDTVGFIQNLPSTLVEGFKTTLESAMEADLLIIVVDISDENYQKHIEVTQSVLSELNIKDKEQIIVFNKKDKLKDQFTPKIIQRNFKQSFIISAHDPEDVSSLREYVIETFLEKQEKYDLFIPYQDGEFHSSVQAHTNIISQKHHEKGIYYKIRIPDFIFNRLGLAKYILAPNDPLISQ